MTYVHWLRAQSWAENTTTHSGNEDVFQRVRPESSHLLPSSYFAVKTIKGKQPISILYTLQDARNCTCTAFYCCTRVYNADLYLWASRTHSYKTWLLAGTRERRIRNIQCDNDMNKSLLFTWAGSITSKTRAEHRWMALHGEARPVLSHWKKWSFPI